ncbi:prephenate dehydrogenase [Allocatelliglobosispora scoriae]|uniref:Prephenate dehydrogenase n=1 Tax=Allocatelliglobosispora scoriae TaxID=643052 RepID=A0A841BY84_9ACTN|nr:prephenate dehydrogenase/arogenate dehydrogenase family protein [Allocatelliglobosispora scoriae]MBB5871680.1 prephenate dehydrogenase [Allocatelliglobosispora scoriae]
MADETTPRLRIAVVGTGLIGGSILLRLHEAGNDVLGWDPQPAARAAAARRRVPFNDRLDVTLKGRDVVFLCGPLRALPESLTEVARLADDGCVITDVGSTKAEIADHAARLGLADRFIPGHPMAGTEKAGLDSAIGSLYDSAPWVLCPSSTDALPGFRLLTRLIIENFGARVVPMEPRAHDAVVALSSHIPHILAGALAGAAAGSAVKQAVLALAAGSFKDGTRVAGTPSSRTADMLISNRAAVVAQLDLVRAVLDGLVASLADADDAELLRRLQVGRGLREELLDRSMLPVTRSFDLARDDQAELDFLRRLGGDGGYVTGQETDATTVTYTALATR